MTPQKKREKQDGTTTTLKKNEERKYSLPVFELRNVHIIQMPMRRRLHIHDANANAYK